MKFVTLVLLGIVTGILSGCFTPAVSLQEQTAARELDAARARLDKAMAGLCAAKNRTIDDRVMCLVNIRLDVLRDELMERSSLRSNREPEERENVARVRCERAGARTVCRLRSRMTDELGGG